MYLASAAIINVAVVVVVVADVTVVVVMALDEQVDVWTSAAVSSAASWDLLQWNIYADTRFLFSLKPIERRGAAAWNNIFESKTNFLKFRDMKENSVFISDECLIGKVTSRDCIIMNMLPRYSITRCSHSITIKLIHRGWAFLEKVNKGKVHLWHQRQAKIFRLAWQCMTAMTSRPGTFRFRSIPWLGAHHKF